MKRLSWIYGTYMLLCAMLLSSCSSWSNTTNGTIISGVGGAIVGAGLGGALGDRHSAEFGAHLGAQLGALTGTAIGAEADAKAYRESNQRRVQVLQSEDATRVFVDNGRKYYRASDDGDILFKSRDTRLDSKAQRSLNRIAGKLKKIKGTIYVYGSTDNVESRDYSKQMSLERARAAAGYLVACGISRERIKVMGLGDTSPVADNSTMEGRALNRSADVYVELE